MSDKKNNGIAKTAVAFILGFVAAAIVFLAANHISTQPKNAILFLHDGQCPLCEQDLSKIEKIVEGNVHSARIVDLDVHGGLGARIYAELQRDKNVNLVPMILITNDVDRKAISELNRALPGAAENLIDLGKYYALRPFWTVRRFVPGKKSTIVDLFADSNVNKRSLEQLVYLAADNVEIREHNAEGDYHILIRSDGNVINVIAPRISLSIRTETSLEVPKISAVLAAKNPVKETLLSMLRANLVKVTETNAAAPKDSVFAVQTNRPYVLARIFPGVRVYPGILVYPKDARPHLDIYLGTPLDRNIISAVAEIADRAPDAVTVTPHYVIARVGNGFTSASGAIGAKRALVEYCVFLNKGAGTWFAFTRRERAECSDPDGCWQKIAKDLNVNVKQVQNCVNDGSKVLGFLAADSTGKGITDGGVLVDGWFPWTGSTDLGSLVCAFSLNPPKTLCGGE